MQICLLFDLLSPYAYLACKALPALAAEHGASIRPVPVLLAGLLNHHGQKGPAEIPSKRLYVFKDALRSAAVLGLPLVPPRAHPFNPLLALRACCLDMSDGQRLELVDALFDATWGGGPGVTDPEVIDRLAADVGVPDASARTRDPVIKQRLFDHTAQAIAAGAFGVPTLLVGDELFFGYDSLGHLGRYLAGDDVIDGDALARWADLPVGASR